ncbi:hypothetical protein AKO1_011418 [Acrasis kona]|uniref:Uncharacterized protein n=1 Tax=Acrasis kona TaxID=1008807 RepID=A0AAW2ZLY6_9EUKA
MMKLPRRPSSPTSLYIDLGQETQTYSCKDAVEHAGFGNFQMLILSITFTTSFCFGARLSTTDFSNKNQILLFLLGITLGTILWKYCENRTTRKSLFYYSLVSALLLQFLPETIIPSSVFINAAVTCTLYTLLSLVKEFSPSNKHKTYITALSSTWLLSFIIHTYLHEWLSQHPSLQISLLIYRFTTTGSKVLTMIRLTPLIVVLMCSPLIPESLSQLLLSEKFNEAEELLRDMISLNDKPTLQGNLSELLESKIQGADVPCISLTSDVNETVIVQEATKVLRAKPSSCIIKPKNISYKMLFTTLEAAIMNLTTFVFLSVTNTSGVFGVMKVLLFCAGDVISPLLVTPSKVSSMMKLTCHTSSALCFMCLYLSGTTESWFFVPLMLLSRIFVSASLSYDTKYKTSDELVFGLSFSLLLSYLITFDQFSIILLGGLSMLTGFGVFINTVLPSPELRNLKKEVGFSEKKCMDGSENHKYLHYITHLYKRKGSTEVVELEGRAQDQNFLTVP